MYSKGCGVKSVNEARNHLLTTGQKSLGNIPPTQAALYEHVKWAIVQVILLESGYCSAKYTKFQWMGLE